MTGGMKLLLEMRADILEENGIEIPEGPDDAWTIDEFDEIHDQRAAPSEFEAIAEQIPVFEITTPA